MNNFKGGDFINRYKLEGHLTLVSALHIGDGEMSSNGERLPKPDKAKKIPEFSTVMTDIKGHAYIPGSTLKGNLRAWVTQIFSSLDLAKVNDTAREDELRNEWEGFSKKKETHKIHQKLKLSEYLFGSGINEGKLEFQDAFIINPISPVSSNQAQALSGYDGKRGTMLLKGVAIDPVSGTAADKKLYNYEAVPPGACFKLTITGQNLLPEELGMLLFALEGFNSQIFPVTMGAMAGIGFGRAKYESESIYCLDKDNLKAWMESAIKTGHAGYNGLTKLDEAACKKQIDKFREVFMAKLESGGAK